MYIYLCFTFRLTIYDFRLNAQTNTKEYFRLTIVDQKNLITDQLPGNLKFTT